MKVTKEQALRARDMYFDKDSGHYGSFRAALQDFVDRNHLVSLPPADLQPGGVMELGKFEPVRDYRKELWIAQWTSAPDDADVDDVAACAKRAVEEFDKFFGGAK